MPQRRSEIRPTTYSFYVLAGLMLAACEVTKPVPPVYAPREVVELERWRVESAGRELGWVAKYEIRDPEGPVLFFRVTDRAGRWLGHATANGRFSRRVPFEEEEQDLGVLSMKRGVAQLFEATAPVDLKPIPVDAIWKKHR